MCGYFSLDGIVRAGLDDLAVTPELEPLRRDVSIVTMIIDDEAVDAPQNGLKPKLQIGNARQGLCPISAHRVLAPQDPRWLRGDLDDKRRGELEVLSVVIKDPIKIVTVPGSDPVIRECLGC